MTPALYLRKERSREGFSPCRLCRVPATPMRMLLTIRAFSLRSYDIRSPIVLG